MLLLFTHSFLEGNMDHLQHSQNRWQAMTNTRKPSISISNLTRIRIWAIHNKREMWENVVINSSRIFSCKLYTWVTHTQGIISLHLSWANFLNWMLLCVGQKTDYHSSSPLYQYLKWCQPCFKRNMIHNFSSRTFLWFTFWALFKQVSTHYISSLNKSIYFMCTMVWTAPAAQLGYMLYAWDRIHAVNENVRQRHGTFPKQNLSRFMILSLSWAHNVSKLLAKRCLSKQPELEFDITPVTGHLISL